MMCMCLKRPVDRTPPPTIAIDETVLHQDNLQQIFVIAEKHNIVQVHYQDFCVVSVLRYSVLRRLFEPPHSKQTNIELLNTSDISRLVHPRTSSDI